MDPTNRNPCNRTVEREARRGGGPPDVKALVLRALAGESLALDRDDFSLHDLTQLALALRPEADLAIRRAGSMTPIEKASVATVGRGRVTFL